MKRPAVRPPASPRARAALKGVASGTAGLIALTAAVLVKPWEGKENTAYRDVVGVWTICYGETKGVTPGQTRSDAECDAMVLARLEQDYYRPLVACIPGYLEAPVSLKAVLLDAAYNLGPATICRSTAARATARGQFEGACYALTAFNQAGGKVLPGLVKRREFGDASRIGELELCLAGLE